MELPRTFDSRNTLTCENARKNPLMIKTDEGLKPASCYADCISCVTKWCPSPNLQIEYPFRLKTLQVERATEDGSKQHEKSKIL
ncbi:MAG: hypothetical protein QXL15_02095, partial [Candidatus Korarchaeota archaeon]